MRCGGNVALLKRNRVTPFWNCLAKCFGDAREIDNEYDFCSSFTRAHRWDRENEMRVWQWLDESRKFEGRLSDSFHQIEDFGQAVQDSGDESGCMGTLPSTANHVTSDNNKREETNGFQGTQPPAELSDNAPTTRVAGQDMAFRLVRIRPLRKCQKRLLDSGCPGTCPANV
jgi:hypothetical protein